MRRHPLAFYKVAKERDNAPLSSLAAATMTAKRITTAYESCYTTEN